MSGLKRIHNPSRPPLTLRGGEVRIKKLKRPFEELVQTYSKEYLFSDPLKFVHQYSDPTDQEVVAFIASALAYGGVPQIFQIVSQVLSKLGDSPARFLKNYSLSEHRFLFKKIYYRFHQSRDFNLLIYLLAKIYQEEGSLGASFKKYFKKEDLDLACALTQWTKEILSHEVSPFYSSGKIPQNAPVRFFFSSPADGSSCKRLNLFLRWMVRGPDGIDLGLWNFISPAQLVIPLDTHIYKIARSLGLTRRKSPNWKMAQEITAHLKSLDPQDPIKYDFALTRLGILKETERLDLFQS